MQYLTYEEYSSLGGELSLTAFQRNIGRACGIIDGATFHRMDCMVEIPSQAKACCRDMVEYISAHSVVDKTVTSRSQSAGGVSESESYAVKTADEMYGDIQNILYDYLYGLCDDKGTPLMYRGAMR